MNIPKPIIQVFIPTFNRPTFFLASLKSVLDQTIENYCITVSDNSTNNDTETLIQDISDPKLRYIHRIPTLPPLDHFKTLLSEVECEYFMIFHDDDIMEQDCLKTLSGLLIEDPEAAAVAGNAYIFWDNHNKFSSKTFMKKGEHEIERLSSPDELAEKYLLFQEIAPFPAYMYRHRKMAGIFADPSEGGQGSDVSFLMKILKEGNILWDNQCVMKYRKHSGQDSQAPDMEDLRSLVRFIVKSTSIKKKSYEVRYFRYKAWAGQLKAEFHRTRGRITSRRIKRIYCCLLKFSPFDIFLKLFIWRLLFFLKREKH